MTNGLVRSAATALLLVLATSSRSEEDLDLMSAPPLAELPGGSLFDQADCNCSCRPGGFWFAGAEATMLQATVRSGGQITASFSDISRPASHSAANAASPNAARRVAKVR